ncbi:MAG: hypothetical protein DA405_10790 [Bacteroidetes bacterium]|nr:MAG: hypothetical protein DA405_10790 [Bacteroidota bacterium]
MKNAKLSLVLVLLVSILGLSNCSNLSVDTKEQTVAQTNLAKQFLRQNCLACHCETARESERLAPPFFAIRKHYLKDYPQKENFEAAMLTFLQEPNEANAIMKGALAKFGLMPKITFPEKDLKLAIEYLYENDQAKPEHAGKGGKSQEKGQVDEAAILKKGESIALQTKKVLGKNLMAAMAEGGSAYAVDFCNVKAINLTDSMGQKLKASVKRVSDKNRNPNNAASLEELTFINKFKDMLAQKEIPTGELLKTADGYRVFYPIITNQMCLQCHGEAGTDIANETLERIRAMYPADLALGYKMNELRGLWVLDYQAD